ncbi:MAG: HNH endonuclease [Gammaproteobacteria bacterium]|nr:HNH endonuclease [Gammaproteobacteria bacterium]
MSKNHYQALSKSQWARLRKQVFTRDGYRCVLCGRASKLHCDHIQPLVSGGSETDPANLQTLCRGCHIQKTRREYEERNPVSPEIQAWADFIRAAFK